MNETGKCLLAKMSEEHDAEEKVFLGKVVDSFKMKETTQYTVNWFKGYTLTIHEFIMMTITSVVMTSIV